QSVEESGGDLVKPGGALTLTCTVSGFSLSNGRFTIPRNTNQNTVTLQMNILTAADTAT
nr:Ig heavy chain V-a region (p26.9a3) - rabbit (fragments) [Oryctolagus cuniculus]